MPAISVQLLNKSFTTRPNSITRAIRLLCREISPRNGPVFVPVEPEPHSLPAECFNNVASIVEQKGGEILYGWAIWEWPTVFVEAEHHAVWKQGGRLIDITPHVQGEKAILFLPDPTRSYDFNLKKRIINIKRSLGVYAEAQNCLDAADRLFQTLESNSIGNEIQIDRRFLEALYYNASLAKGRLLIEIASRLKPHDRCLCQSGKKFRKCCSQLIDWAV